MSLKDRINEDLKTAMKTGEKLRTEAGPFVIPQVGFADQPFALQLVPLAMMQDNPHGLNLGTPSIGFHVADIDATRAGLGEAPGDPFQQMGGLAWASGPHSSSRYESIVGVMPRAGASRSMTALP